MIASVHHAYKLYPFVDVEIAMGWRSAEQVVTLPGPTLAGAISCVRKHFDELVAAIQNEPERFVEAGIARMRKQGFIPPTN
jgi:hypothetical protein